MTQTDRAAALEAARRRRAELITAGQLERLDPMERARRAPQSLRLAITAKCWTCVGGDADPHPRRRIRECECSRCPLHSVRPYQRSAAASGEIPDSRARYMDESGISQSDNSPSNAQPRLTTRGGYQND